MPALRPSRLALARRLPVSSHEVRTLGLTPAAFQTGSDSNLVGASRRMAPFSGGIQEALQAFQNPVPDPEDPSTRRDMILCCA